MPEPRRKPAVPHPGPPHNPGLRKLIEGKRKGHRPEHTLPPLPTEVGVPAPTVTANPSDPNTGTPASAGSTLINPGTPDLSSSGSPSPFLGWHERGYLPHFDAPNVTQFVTFMLHDCFPVTRRREWESALNEPTDSQRRRKLEAWLDRGHGECWLRQPPMADLVEAKLREQDSKNYRLQAWVIMPNHVHLVVDVWQTPLAQLLKLWKGGSARAANLALRRAGRFWEREYFDTLIRDEEHLRKAIHYTEANPVRAKLVADRKSWPWGSARWRDEYERLPWQRAAG